MYSASRTRGSEDTAGLIEALRPVADAVRKKRYHLNDGSEKPGHFMVELALPVRHCKRVMELVDAADFASLLDASSN